MQLWGLRIPFRISLCISLNSCLVFRCYHAAISVGLCFVFIFTLVRRIFFSCGVRFSFSRSVFLTRAILGVFLALVLRCEAFTGYVCGDDECST